MTISTPTADQARLEGALWALTEFAWMARRTVSTATYADAPETRLAHDEATWVLHRLAKAQHIRIRHPDQTANRDWDKAPEIVETPSYFSDGAPIDFAPDATRIADLGRQEEDDPDGLVQWLIDVLHPLAHVYADGRATYATSMLNNATRGLRRADWSLAATEALGKSAWVRDGFGEGYDALSREEAEERDLARAKHAGQRK